jgi:membrane associated rhomboid family serine protease
MKFYQIKRRRPSTIRKLSITAWLIIITAIISLLVFILTFISEDYINYFALRPASIMSGQYLWALITHMFVHGGLAHLAINMFVLFSLGDLCERIIGRKRFLWFYLLSGLLAGILSVILAHYFGTAGLGERIFGSPDVYMVGASGAIFAISGLYVMLLPRLKFMIIFLPFFSLPAYIMIPLVLFGVWLVTVLSGLPIGNVAHFGGFLVGITYGLYLRKKYKNKVQMLQQMFR